jgi:nucleoside-diphosphate-sugar epimerase
MLLITGATGFIGSQLLKLIAADENVEVKILSRRNNLPDCPSNNVKFFQGNLLSEKCLADFIEEGSTIVNLAYLSSHSIDDNLRAARNLARTCAAKKVRRLVHCSTAVVVGRSGGNIISEATACHPVTPYEKTKFQIEKLFIEELGDEIEVAIIRPTAVFGPGGQNLIKITREINTQNFLARALKMSLYAKRKLNLVSVENVVGAIKFLAFFDGMLPHRRYIVSDDDDPENNYKDIVIYLATTLRREIPPHLPIPFQPQLLSLVLRLAGRTNFNPERIYSSSRLISTGYRKQITFRKALERFADWARLEIFAGNPSLQ